MSKKANILVMLESQIDKIVLGLMIIISLALLWLYVLSNPYAVEVSGKKYGPGQIDKVVKEKAERILVEMDEPAEPQIYNQAFAADFDKRLQCPVSDIENLAIPYPGIGDVVIEEDRMYAIPEIGTLTDVTVASLRGAAEIPLEEVGPDNPYKSAPKELGDIDLVTVSANFDIGALADNFQLSFMGPQLKSSWKDSKLARPVMARLELQRRVLTDSGWDQWEVVPRTKIDMFKRRLEELPLTAEETQFGVNVYIPTFDTEAVQYDILQPDAYDFKVSKLDWLAPPYLHQMADVMQKEADQKRRDEIDARRKEQESERNRRSQRTRTQVTRPQRGGGNMMMDPMMGEMAMRQERQPLRKEELTPESIEQQMEQAKLKEGTSLASLQESTLIWAHDDTAEPGNTYQYRLRLGVFNPIAGKDWFRKDQEDYKDQFVLWSDYSEPSEEVFIPKMVHVFPMEVIASADKSNPAEGASVEVAKYFLGQWRTHTFDVYPGETIGYELEDTDQEDTKGRPGQMDTMMMDPMMMEEGGINRGPEVVDFSTGLTMVDISRQVDWGTRLRRGFLYQLIYYDPEMQMQQITISKRNWQDQLRSDYNDIQEELNQDVKRRPRQMDEMMMDPMMMELM